MKKLTPLIGTFLGLLATLSAHAYDFRNQVTANGVEYGFHQADKNAPLLITITTDIKESMTDVYSPVGGLLAAKGYNIAAIDVTCHGRDIKKKEKYGLDCWRTRADASSENIFDNYIQNLKSVIADIEQQQLADTSNTTVLGISRGGYLAMKAASEIQQVSIVIALAPVTDIFRLREFDGAKAPRSIYSPQAFFAPLSTKHLFIQINNSDDRVGTAEALETIAGITNAGGQHAVDLTAILTPRKNHSTSEHEAAAAWALNTRKNRGESAQLAAPK
ncbi:alpha/beta hydrolase family protein [Pseudomonas taiwanensis]|uniref:alpha/beta hydrolase family protein n=1 Tax=Pseudomonas taiwanensis TaxID=470150 RepID=UPI001648DBD2|nr:alpha/beta hydrolase [Pseudomonas taiwanensis]MBC3491890.1 alpha/beta hydrolase [Pseudomonas taiwanensis]